MKYIGIDLGTTNSAICSYDGEITHIYKSPEQHDVTPSAIFFDKRGNKYVGARAYNSAARSPNNAATLFKRYMGTSTIIKLNAVNIEMTPEECSVEVLKTLFGYLPEELRNNPDTGTVITVPAAFNQMQKDATMSAAHSAGIGNVALMQEPVAAVMSVMKTRKSDGIFLVYDLGGGTLDIAIAESVSGRVNLLGHGGIAMCGGRDFDRILFDNIVKPWLLKNFNLPENIYTNQDYKTLVNMATWATEKAKIELSQRDEAIISLPETELGVKDLDGEEIYIDIPMNRSEFDKLIDEKIMESIHAARESLQKTGLSPHDVERVVFVGGPTNYKPLRDKVSFELGIAASTEVNPMIAVAEGAAIFAESIDWASESRGRKSSRGSMSTGSLELSFNYIARTPDVKAKIIAKLSTLANGEFQIDSLDTGWSSGRIKLVDGASFELTLSKPGDNTFKVFVFDQNGGSISLKDDKIVITRTAASIDAIPSSSSIGIETIEKVGGSATIDYLIKEGEHLPKKGQKIFKAAESLRAGSNGSFRFKLWEGEIKDPITDNRFIGMFEIKGSDFEDTIIPAGADLICDYEVLDSGNIVLEVSVPSVSGLFHSNRNFYSRQEGGIDYANASKLVDEEAKKMIERIKTISEKVNDDRLKTSKRKLEKAQETVQAAHGDPETTKQAMDDIQDSKKVLAKVRQEHLKIIRQQELDNAVNFFDEVIREHAKPSEESAFDNLAKTAQNAINQNRNEFESILSELRGKNFDILWKQDWFVIDRFRYFSERPHLYANQNEYTKLIADGEAAIQNDEMEKVRYITWMLFTTRVTADDGDSMLASANIIRG